MMTPAVKDKLLHRRQFLFASGGVEPLPGCRMVEVGSGCELSVHPDLDVARVEADGVLVVLLGFILDPAQPQRGNREIVEGLLAETRGAADFAMATSEMGGRWVLLRRDAAGWTIVHDATGQRQVCFTRGPRAGGFLCASDAGIIASRIGLEMDAAAVDFIRSRGESDFEVYWMPGDRTLYREVAALLPNHFLTLPDGGAHRFWPVREPARRDPDEAHSECLAILRGLIAAAGRRFPLSVPMTAGWDSRLMLALCRDRAADLYAYTFDYPNMPRNSRDVWVPARLLPALGISHQVIPYPETIGADFKRLHRICNVAANDSYCADAQALYAVYPEGHVCVTGDAAEVVKCYHARADGATGKVGARELAAMSGLGGHPFVIAAMSEWLEEAGDPPVELLDLFCWEQMAGRWQPKVRAEYDMVQDCLAPLSHRRLLETMLGVDPALRRAPDFTFIARLVMALWPEALSVPVNPPETLGGKRRALNLLKKTGIHRIIPSAARQKLKATLRRRKPGTPAN
jgi:hypothetical protein